MPHSLTLQVDPESLNFLTQCKKKHLSAAQRVFMDKVKEAHKSLSQLKEQNLFEFTADNETEITRGKFYAITPSLQEKIKKEEAHLETQAAQKASKEKISLEDLQAALENDFQVSDKETLSFITLCLVEPVWLPGALSAMACEILMRSTSYHCTNNSSGSLKCLIETGAKHILFQLDDLEIFTPAGEKRINRGAIGISFTIDNTTSPQVKLLPIRMQFNFPDEAESGLFQQDLAKNFGSWLLHQDELTKINAKRSQTALIPPEHYVIPILLGLLIGSIAMVSFTALGLSVISVALLPPLGLALGLILAILTSSGTYLINKKEEKKLQRPIRLFNKKQVIHSPTQAIQTTSFFAHSSELSQAMMENKLGLRP